MVQINWKRLAILLVCAVIPFWWSFSIRRDANGGIKMTDFGGTYYGARCVMQHRDPYDTKSALREFESDGGRLPFSSLQAKVALIVITIGVNLPTALLLVAPFAMMPWGIAQVLWIVLMEGLLVLAAFLIGDMGTGKAQIIPVSLAGAVLANCEILFVVGNVAGISVSLCIVATWCFLKERHVLAGVLLLAVSLVLKPHDAGFVWLYFLLAGGAHRKRALQTLVVTGILGLFAAIWIAPSSPHWVQELHRNHIRVAARGGTSDPGPFGISSRTAIPILGLQAAFSALRDDPQFYNPVSYLISGLLILMWAIAVLCRRYSRDGALLALSAISVLTLLPVYHRTYDAKLLLLTLPACALLWNAGGARRWISLGLTSAAILVTSDLPMLGLSMASKGVIVSTSTLTGKMFYLALQPAPLVLLATGIFYLWAYADYQAQSVMTRKFGETIGQQPVTI